MSKYFYKVALRKGQKIYKNYDKEFDSRDSFVSAARVDYLRLIDTLSRKYNDPDLSVSDVVTQLLGEKELSTFIARNIISTHYSDSERSSKVSSVLGVTASALIDASKRETARSVVEGLLVSKYNKDVVTPLQENILRALPPQIVKELPQNIIIDADADGTITQINDKLVNKGRTLLEKANRMKRLIEEYNEVVDQVKADLKSPQEIIRISAILTSIIMETGIRPGRPGQKAVVKDSEVETFGVSTFTPKHIKFLTDVAELEFVGKRGKTNLAELKDAEVISLLQDYVDKAKGRSADQPQVFRDKHGTLYRYETLMWYMKNKLKGFTPSDFRRLKASREAYAQLKKEYAFLREQIEKDVDVTAENAKEKVASLVASSINYSIKQARKALSHEPSSAAIYAYVTPSIVMQFINNNMKDTFEESILQGESKLSFDVQKFMADIKSKTPAQAETPVEKQPTLRDVQKETVAVMKTQVADATSRAEAVLSQPDAPAPSPAPSPDPVLPESSPKNIRAQIKELEELLGYGRKDINDVKDSLNDAYDLNEYLERLKELYEDKLIEDEKRRSRLKAPPAPPAPPPPPAPPASTEEDDDELDLEEFDEG